MSAGAALKKRKPDTGLVRPYRPKPADFRETYVRMGWDEIDEHYRTNWRVIRRWIMEEGADDLKAARRAYVAERGPLPRHTIERRVRLSPTVDGGNRLSARA